MTLPPDDCNDCYRGISRRDALFGQGVDVSVFAPDRDTPIRENWLGTSVNWDVLDGGALSELRNRTNRNGNRQFQGGAAHLPRIGLDSIIKRYGFENFGYEWNEEGENGNIYHGHLLFSDRLPRERRSAIYGALAYICTIC